MRRRYFSRNIKPRKHIVSPDIVRKLALNASASASRMNRRTGDSFFPFLCALARPIDPQLRADLRYDRHVAHRVISPTSDPIYRFPSFIHTRIRARVIIICHFQCPEGAERRTRGNGTENDNESARCPRCLIGTYDRGNYRKLLPFAGVMTYYTSFFSLPLSLLFCTCSMRMCWETCFARTDRQHSSIYIRGMSVEIPRYLEFIEFLLSTSATNSFSGVNKKIFRMEI